MEEKKLKDTEQGLYKKYIINKSDGRPVDPDAEYFVLRVDIDPFARQVLRYYAELILEENPNLAIDLKGLCAKYDGHTKEMHDSVMRASSSPIVNGSETGRFTLNEEETNPKEIEPELLKAESNGTVINATNVYIQAEAADKLIGEDHFIDALRYAYLFFDRDQIPMNHPILKGEDFNNLSMKEIHKLPLWCKGEHLQKALKSITDQKGKDPITHEICFDDTALKNLGCDKNNVVGMTADGKPVYGFKFKPDLHYCSAVHEPTHGYLNSPGHLQVESKKKLIAQWKSSRSRYSQIREVLLDLKKGLKSGGNSDLDILPCAFCGHGCDECDWKNVFNLCRNHGGPGNQYYDRLKDGIDDAIAAANLIVERIEVRIKDLSNA